jgi:hypothetical protein
MTRPKLTPLLVASAILTSVSAWAGPPLICHKIEIGKAKSLPWLKGDAFNLADPSYDIARLPDDTLALLNAAAPLNIRMETMRRAAIYSAKDTNVSTALLARLLARAMDAEAVGKADAFAWFDAGYFVESLRQATLVYRWDMLTPAEKSTWRLRQDLFPDVDGRLWVQKALRIGGTAEMRAAAGKLNEGRPALKIAGR